MAQAFLHGSTAGENVTAEVSEYSSLLTDLEDTINALPDVGEGSGGASIDVCSVRVKSSEHALIGYFTQYVNSNFSVIIVDDRQPNSQLISVENVPCNSMFVITNEQSVVNYHLDIAGTAAKISTANSTCYIMQAPSVANEVCEIEIIYVEEPGEDMI